MVRHKKEDMKIDFWGWVNSRQDARQWTEDEKACAEMAWNAAIDAYDKSIHDFVNVVCSQIDDELGGTLGA
jgi:hypothetical protein